jgi:molybdopterin-guanine dinucleotide biosynthesis protein A
MNTEIPTNNTAAAEPESTNDHSFLGLYVKKDLKSKIAAAAKQEERSMSKFASRVFEKHFANA